MTTGRPDWLTKYTAIGFDENWADDLLDSHSESLYTNLPASHAPENFIGVEPLQLASDAEFLHSLTVPPAHTVTEVALFTLDMLDAFGAALPATDTELYETYQAMTDTAIINVTADFSSFYVFARRLKYTAIQNLPEYKLLAKAVETNVYDSWPIPNTTWELPYRDGRIRGTVDETVTTPGLDEIIDGPSLVQVDAVVSPISETDVCTGDTVSVQPAAFNEGEMLTGD